jgi:hypothetical protein
MLFILLSYSLIFLNWANCVSTPLAKSDCIFNPHVFQLCDFTPVILKRRSNLPLPRYVMLMVLNMMRKDRIALVILPLM